MTRPIYAEIHQRSIASNLKIFRKHCAGAKVFAVLKANAYGHGIENVFSALKAVDGFAVLEMDEAKRLRALGWTGPVLMLEGVFDQADLETCSQLDLWHVVHCDEQIEMLSLQKTSYEHTIFLKVNTGLNRLGFSPLNVKCALDHIGKIKHVGKVILMTHLSDGDNKQIVDHQLDVLHSSFAHSCDVLSVYNSVATLCHNNSLSSPSHWVRVGCALFGSSPDYPNHSAAYWELVPSMSFRTSLITVQTLNRGDAVGYGSTFVAPVDMKIGIAACGYGDGYPRSCESGTPVLVDGIVCKTVGRVSMDLLAIDLTDIFKNGLVAVRGSEVTLWGKSSLKYGEVVLSIDVIATHARTIGYELMCGLAQRVPLYIRDN